MTGYAAAAAGSPRGTLSLELRSVNSRFLDLQFRIAEALRAHEPLLRERISARVARGKIDCRLSLTEEPTQGAAQLNGVMISRLKALADAARKSFPDAAPLSMADILRWPGMVAEPTDDEGLRSAVDTLCSQALDDFVAARSREGAKLAAGIVERVRAMLGRVDEVTPLVPQALAAYQEKISQRLREAIGSADDERIRAELALFAARADIAEEIDRLRAHLAEVERVLKEGGTRSSPVGKRLDFLAQELNREANTLASKAASPAIADCALELKVLVEQIREQVQNIE